MKIFVTNITGETITLDVDHSYTIAAVKARIHVTVAGEYTKILTFAGESLQDHHTLAHYNITDGITLQLELHRHDAMVISVDPPTSEKITLEVKRSDTVEHVKRLVTAMTRERYGLVFAGNRPAGDGTLADYGVREGSILRVEARQFSKAIQIFVRVIQTGKTFGFKVESSDTIGDLKDIIRHRHKAASGKLPARLKLMFDGEKLEDRHSFEDYGIQDESILDLGDN